MFTNAKLAKFGAIIFAFNSEPNTTPVTRTPPMLNASQRKALQHFFSQPGKGYVGIHSASAALFVDGYYSQLCGASFDHHADSQPATFVKTSNTSSTSFLPARWRLQDEVYAFLGDPRKTGARVMLSVDESSYSGYKGNSTRQGRPHPIAWQRDSNVLSSAPGRSWYTALGHETATWSNPIFLKHVQAGIAYVLG